MSRNRTVSRQFIIFQPEQAYSIPYRLEDRTGTVIQAGALAVSAINVQ